MALYGTHDTTIAALLSTLGVFDNRWPHFTSNITFELFKAQRGGLLSFLPGWVAGRGGEYFVRMRYNQSVVKLPGTTPPIFRGHISSGLYIPLFCCILVMFLSVLRGGGRSFRLVN
jgi:hypothetical protein